MFSEPLTIQGFYAARVFARRAVKAVVVTVLVAGCLALGSLVIGAVAADLLFFALVIRW